MSQGRGMTTSVPVMHFRQRGRSKDCASSSSSSSSSSSGGPELSLRRRRGPNDSGAYAPHVMSVDVRRQGPGDGSGFIVAPSHAHMPLSIVSDSDGSDEAPAWVDQVAQHVDKHGKVLREEGWVTDAFHHSESVSVSSRHSPSRKHRHHRKADKASDDGKAAKPEAVPPSPPGIPEAVDTDDGISGGGSHGSAWSGASRRSVNTMIVSTTSSSSTSSTTPNPSRGQIRVGGTGSRSFTGSRSHGSSHCPTTSSTITHDSLLDSSQSHTFTHSYDYDHVYSYTGDVSATPRSQWSASYSGSRSPPSRSPSSTPRRTSPSVSRSRSYSSSTTDGEWGVPRGRGLKGKEGRRKGRKGRKGSHDAGSAQASSWQTIKAVKKKKKKKRAQGLQMRVASLPMQLRESKRTTRGSRLRPVIRTMSSSGSASHSMVRKSQAASASEIRMKHVAPASARSSVGRATGPLSIIESDDDAPSPGGQSLPTPNLSAGGSSQLASAGGSSQLASAGGSSQLVSTTTVSSFSGSSTAVRRIPQAPEVPPPRQNVLPEALVDVLLDDLASQVVSVVIDEKGDLSPDHDIIDNLVTDEDIQAHLSRSGSFSGANDDDDLVMSDSDSTESSDGYTSSGSRNEAVNAFHAFMGAAVAGVKLMRRSRPLIADASPTVSPSNASPSIASPTVSLSDASPTVSLSDASPTVAPAIAPTPTSIVPAPTTIVPAPAPAPTTIAPAPAPAPTTTIAPAPAPAPAPTPWGQAEEVEAEREIVQQLEAELEAVRASTDALYQRHRTEMESLREAYARAVSARMQLEAQTAERDGNRRVARLQLEQETQETLVTLRALQLESARLSDLAVSFARQ